MPTNRTTPVLPLSSQETLQDQHLGSGPGSYEIIAFPLVLGACKTLCASSKSGVPPPSLVQLLCSSPTGLQSQCLWTSYPNVQAQEWENWCRAQNSYSYGRTSAIVLQTLSLPMWGMGYCYIASVPFLQSPCGFFFVSECRISFWQLTVFFMWTSRCSSWF